MWQPQVTARVGLWLVVGLLATTAAGATTKTYENPGDVVLPSGETRTSTIVVSDVGLITDLNVINVTQRTPYTGRLTITLTDPTGAVTVLVKESGDGGTGDGIYNVDFDDSAASGFPGFQSDGQCVTNATYQSHENLSAFNGLQVNGLWTLTIADSGGGGRTDCDCAITNGPACDRELDNWGMEISFDPLPPCDTVTVDGTIAMMETHQACRELQGGPTLTISTTLGAKLFAGETVVLQNGMTVDTDAELAVGVCGLDLCSTGPPLESTCSPCVTSICSVDTFCCDDGFGSWDPQCVFKVGAFCNLGC